MATTSEAAKTATRRVFLWDRPRRTSAWRYPIWRLAGYVIFLATWSFLSEYVLEPYTLPSPLEVLDEMVEILRSGDFWVNLWATGKHLLIGFSIAFVLGTAIGIMMGRSAYWDGFFRDYIMLTLTTPGLVFALIAVMVFGLKAVGPVLAIVLTSMPHITVNVEEGVRSIPRDLGDMATAFGVSRSTQIRQIVIPAVAPFLFTAVRYGFAIAWKITALTELFGGADGVGIQIKVNYQFFNVAGVLAWAFFLVGLALIIERLLLTRLERRFFRWRPTTFV